MSLLDRWLHGSRHRRAKGMLQRIGRPRSIVIVCYGNVCRSPFLEALLQRGLPDIDVSSAGLAGAGRPVPEYGRTIATRMGLDLSHHRSRVLNWEILRRAELVIVMDALQARYVAHKLRFSRDRILMAGDLDSLPHDERAIHDPIQQSLAVFESTYERLSRCADSLTGILRIRK